MQVSLEWFSVRNRELSKSLLVSHRKRRHWKTWQLVVAMKGTVLRVSRECESRNKCNTLNNSVVGPFSSVWFEDGTWCNSTRFISAKRTRYNWRIHSQIVWTISHLPRLCPLLWGMTYPRTNVRNGKYYASRQFSQNKVIWRPAWTEMAIASSRFIVLRFLSNLLTNNHKGKITEFKCHWYTYRQ